MATILTNSFRNRLSSTLLLLTLHAAIVTGVENPVARSLILAHMGLFLIWQPIWRGDHRLNWQNTIVFVLLVSAFVIWLDWWLITGWLILLIGLTGGRLPQTTQERNTNLVILFFLFIELLIGCASHLFPIRLDGLFISIFNSGLFFLPLLILLLPGKQQASEKMALQVDLFGAITTALLASLLLLGSIINSHPLTDQDYSTALVRTFLFIGVLILLISWLLSPRTGFSGLAELWTQSLLNIGTPFERWVSEIATLKTETESPEDFLDHSTHKLLSLPMIDGVIWQTAESNRRHGLDTENRVDIESEHLKVTIMTSRRIGATLLLHFKLLVSIVDHFYTAKEQERELARQAHMQAIYETGARVTHDIKNILQSFHNMTAVMSLESRDKSEATVKLLKKQLPILQNRLELALTKLQRPDHGTRESISIKTWWERVQLQFSDEKTTFIADLQSESHIPTVLFDSVIENLLENAKSKFDDKEQLQVKVLLEAQNNHIKLEVTDNGDAIPGNITEKLFKTPLRSTNGFGVGLLQSAELAEKLGFRLYLKTNEAGNVTFCLTTKTDN